MKFITALRFLTILPLPRWRESGQADVGPSLVYFPVVGLIIGLFLAGLSRVLLMVLPPPITHLLVLIALVLITGALHLDGLADTCDGLAGHTVEDRWRIMRDSHTGSFGVAGIVCLLLLKYVSLNNVPAQWLVPALVLMPMAGRWAMVYAISLYPYARPTGLGRVFKQQANGKNLIIATVFVLAVAGLSITFSSSDSALAD